MNNSFISNKPPTTSTTVQAAASPTSLLSPSQTVTPKQPPKSNLHEFEMNAASNSTNNYPSSQRRSSLGLSGEVGDKQHQQSRMSASINKHNNNNNNFSSDDDDNLVIRDSLSDNDDDLGDSFGNSGSENRSRTSGSSRGSAAVRKSSLPCGISVTLLQGCVIMIPIILIIVYTSIPMSAAIKITTFLQSNGDLFTASARCGTGLIDERRLAILQVWSHDNASRQDDMIMYGDLTWSAVKAQYAAKQAEVDTCLDDLLSKIRDSGSTSMHEALVDVQDIASNLANLRQTVRDDTVDDTDMRSSYEDFVNQAFTVTETISRDRTIQDIEGGFTILMIMLRIENSLTLLRDSATLSMLGVTNARYRRGVYQDMQSSMNMVVSDDYLARKASHEGTEQIDLDFWQKSGSNGDSFKLFLAMSEALLHNDGNMTAINETGAWTWLLPGGSLNILSYLRHSDEMFRKLRQSTLKEVQEIVDDKDARSIMVNEILKLVIAVVFCCITAAIVIYVNAQEQNRIVLSLLNTEKLAIAVQRFVPKNQLRTMGARSITQVHPNLAVEVAQAILHSSLHGFAGMSEKMKNLELFEWLAKYVARMNDVVAAEKGYVNLVTGDSMSCVFPDCTSATNSAIAMHVAAEQLNLELVSHKGSNLVKIGIGINHSVVVCGVFGNEQRLSCAMVSSDIALASQLEEKTSSYGAKIIISNAVASQLNPENYSTRYLGILRQEGSVIVVELYEIFTADAVKLKELKNKYKKEFEDAAYILEDLFEEDFIKVQNARLRLLEDVDEKKQDSEMDDEDRASAAQEILEIKTHQQVYEERKKARARKLSHLKEQLSNNTNSNNTMNASPSKKQQQPSVLALTPENQRQMELEYALNTLTTIKHEAEAMYRIDGAADKLLTLFLRKQGFAYSGRDNYNGSNNINNIQESNNISPGSEKFERMDTFRGLITLDDQQQIGSYQNNNNNNNQILRGGNAPLQRILSSVMLTPSRNPSNVFTNNNNNNNNNNTYNSTLKEFSASSSTPAQIKQQPLQKKPSATPDSKYSKNNNNNNYEQIYSPTNRVSNSNDDDYYDSESRRQQQQQQQKQKQGRTDSLLVAEARDSNSKLQSNNNNNNTAQYQPPRYPSPGTISRNEKEKQNAKKLRNDARESEILPPHSGSADNSREQYDAAMVSSDFNAFKQLQNKNNNNNQNNNNKHNLHVHINKNAEEEEEKRSKQNPQQRAKKLASPPPSDDEGENEVDKHNMEKSIADSHREDGDGENDNNTKNIPQSSKKHFPADQKKLVQQVEQSNRQELQQQQQRPSARLLLSATEDENKNNKNDNDANTNSAGPISERTPPSGGASTQNGSLKRQTQERKPHEVFDASDEDNYDHAHEQEVEVENKNMKFENGKRNNNGYK